MEIQIKHVAAMVDLLVKVKVTVNLCCRVQRSMRRCSYRSGLRWEEGRRQTRDPGGRHTEKGKGYICMCVYIYLPDITNISCEDMILIVKLITL